MVEIMGWLLDSISQLIHLSLSRLLPPTCSLAFVPFLCMKLSQQTERWEARLPSLLLLKTWQFPLFLPLNGAVDLVGESASSHVGLPLTQDILLYTAVPIDCRNMTGERLSKSPSLFAINFIENWRLWKVFSSIGKCTTCSSIFISIMSWTLLIHAYA